jgi:ribonuclease HI
MESNALIIYCDGGARGNPGPSAAAFLVHKNGKIIYSDAKYLGTSTNNFAEYNAVLFALTWLKGNIKEAGGIVKIYIDSELVANQLNGEYKIKSPNLKEIFLKIVKIKKEVRLDVYYIAIPRTKNRLADHLVNKLLDSRN